MTETIVNPHEYRTKVFNWAEDVGLHTVKLVIYQPKANGVTEYVMPIDELRIFAQELHKRADHVRVADAMHTQMPMEEWAPIYLNQAPNDEDCGFCRAMAECPSVQGKLQRDALVDFTAVIDEAPTPDIDLIVAKAKPVELNNAMKVVPLMEAWLKAVRAEVERRLLAGETLEDFGLELGRQGNREFKDQEEAEQMMKDFRMTCEDMYTFKLKSPTQIEKLTMPQKMPDNTVGKPRLGLRRWDKLQTLVARAAAKPSVRLKSVIKTPYIPPQLTHSGFEAVDDSDDLT